MEGRSKSIDALSMDRFEARMYILFDRVHMEITTWL
jgi:hypothetical protein